ncbi:hypothetical protein PanWU01x14_029240 [Parasponia andersonii]|uniref:Transmembrane protein n=1 Tax=Parasponia andersonii TaxID=3476 RepID=A0A2P5DVH4_PARAD|nr:hypothetical protein PanWU01x14_029240 [Parasponia andersonii]
MGLGPDVSGGSGQSYSILRLHFSRGGKCTSWVGYVAAELGIVVVIPLVVMFQYVVRHSPLRIDDIVASISSSSEEGSKPRVVEMVG